MGSRVPRPNMALDNWEIAFGPHRSIEDAVDARMHFLEERGDITGSRCGAKWLEDRRAELPGTYIVGSLQSAHYMTVTIEPSGHLTGFDPQNGAVYPSFEAVQGRMGRDQFQLVYKLTSSLPPVTPP